MDKIDQIAKALNRLFEMDLDWSFRGTLRAVSRDEIEEVNKVCGFLAERFYDQKMQNALWILQMHKFHISQAARRRRFLESFSLSAEEKDRFYKSLTDHVTGDIFTVSSRIGFPAKEFRQLSEEERISIVKDFYLIEEKILKDAGLHQAAVATIIGRIKIFENNLIRNLCQSKSVLTGKYVKSIKAMINFAERLQKWCHHSRAKDDNVPLDPVAHRNLSRTKDKIIGLATLWGDSTPLLLKGDWGIASVISATAGATVAVFYD